MRICLEEMDENKDNEVLLLLQCMYLSELCRVLEETVVKKFPDGFSI